MRRPISGSKDACAYPELFAACRGALKLLEPSHPLNGVTSILLPSCACAQLRRPEALASEHGTHIVSISRSLRTREICPSSKRFHPNVRRFSTPAQKLARASSRARAPSRRGTRPKSHKGMSMKLPTQEISDVIRRLPRAQKER